MQEFAFIFIFVPILLLSVVLYNQFKIMKKISKVEKLNISSDKEGGALQKNDIKKENPLVAAAIIAAINQHKKRRG
ncbi:MAG: hypothetical protein LBG67_00635 [Campylobacteraceae bacterium]|jgi:Na+-transporting methylmalonyl-CoA/oxaloacetate decarboxylase gamma subunit|nr:hypothetical protein [Campylobacteraceae bacterium]